MSLPMETTTVPKSKDIRRTNQKKTYVNYTLINPKIEPTSPKTYKAIYQSIQNKAEQCKTEQSKVEQSKAITENILSSPKRT